MVGAVISDRRCIAKCSARSSSAPFRGRVVCRAQPARETTVRQVASHLAAGTAALALLLSPMHAPAAYAAEAPPEAPADAAQLVAEEESRATYQATLEENKRKAELLAKRQALENRVQQIEDMISRKLTEESANELAATNKGELDRAARIQQQEAALTQTEQELKAAQAQAEAALAREEMVERARAASTQQQIDKAGKSLLQMLGFQ